MQSETFVVTVTPCREKNAIKNVAFAVHFQHSFSEIDLEKIKKLHRGKKDEFPRLEEKRAVSIQFDPASKVQKAGRDELAGLVFQHINPDGAYSWKFTVEDNRAVVECANYTQWVEVWNRSKALFHRFMAPVVENNPVIVTGLEYLDEFRIHAEPRENNWFGQLFSENTKYLGADALRPSPFWHSHMGFFTGGEGDKTPRMLTRINLDCLVDQSDQKYKVLALTHHHIDLIEPTAFQIFDAQQMDDLFATMHTANKEVLRDLLTDEMCRSIGLSLS